LNVVDAIRSNLDFRIVGTQLWFRVANRGDFFEPVYEGREEAPCTTLKALRPSDILKDYEVREPTTTITWNSFWDAIAGLYKDFPDMSIIKNEHAQNLARRLGLVDRP